ASVHGSVSRGKRGEPHFSRAVEECDMLPRYHSASERDPSCRDWERAPRVAGRATGAMVSHNAASATSAASSFTAWACNARAAHRRLTGGGPGGALVCFLTRSVCLSRRIGYVGWALERPPA